MRILFTLLSLLVCHTSFAQNDFDSKITAITEKMVKKLESYPWGNNKRTIAVTNFVDLQGNVTELGKYLGEVFSIEFVGAGLKVVDRSRMDALITELKLNEEKLTDPENALKLGHMAGVKILIIGTTVMLDNAIDITIKALDIEEGRVVQAARGTVPRTDAINQLFTSRVTGGGKPSSTVTMAQGAGNGRVDASDDVNQVKVTPMKESICDDEKKGHFGYVCFENQLKADLELFYYKDVARPHRVNMLIAAGGKACSPLILTATKSTREPGSKEVVFHFRTTNSKTVFYGTYTIVVEGCVTKSVVLHPRNILLQSKVPLEAR